MRWCLAISVLTTLLLPAGADAEAFPVTTTADSGAGSLRAAIEAADGNESADAIPIGVGGMIDLQSALPDIVGTLRIEGPGETALRVHSTGAFRVFTARYGSDLSLYDLTISNGRAVRGGGIESDGTLLLERVAVTDNEAMGETGRAALAQGGGIYSLGPLTLRESRVSGNRASSSPAPEGAFAFGGGVSAFGATRIVRSTIDDNFAFAEGVPGAVEGAGVDLFGFNVPISIESSTIFRNQAGSPGAALGGGIKSYDTISLASSTVSGNSVSGNVAISRGSNLALPASAIVRDSIVSEGNGAPNCAVPVQSAGYNLGDGGECGFTDPTDLAETNPGLSTSLADNGGPTATLALLPGSAALDRGNAFGASIDQRGLPRISDFGAIPNAAGGDGSDIGAFERQDVVAPVVTIRRGPRRRSRKTVARFVFTADEAGATFQCRIDRRRFVPCRSPFVRRVRRKRTHTFAVKATDVAGNVGAVARRRWRVTRRPAHHRRRAALSQ